MNPRAGVQENGQRRSESTYKWSSCRGKANRLILKTHIQWNFLKKKTWIHVSKGYTCSWKSQSRMVTKTPHNKTPRLKVFQKSFKLLIYKSKCLTRKVSQGGSRLFNRNIHSEIIFSQNLRQIWARDLRPSQAMLQASRPQKAAPDLQGCIWETSLGIY